MKFSEQKDTFSLPKKLLFHINVDVSLSAAMISAGVDLKNAGAEFPSNTIFPSVSASNEDTK